MFASEIENPQTCILDLGRKSLNCVPDLENRFKDITTVKLLTKNSKRTFWCHEPISPMITSRVRLPGKSKISLSVSPQYQFWEQDTLRSGP